MKVFVIEENQLREQHRLLVTRLTLSVLVNPQEGLCRHLAKCISGKAKGHSDKRVVTTGTAHGVQLHFDSLEALLKISLNLVHGVFPAQLLCGVMVSHQVESRVHVFLTVLVVGLYRIRGQDFVNLRDGETTVLLRSGCQDNVTQNIKSSVKGLRLIVPDVAHFKAASHHSANITQAAVDGVQSGRLVMDVDVPFLASLQFVLRHKEPTVQALVEFVENQAAFGSHQCGVRVCVLLVPDKSDGLALDVDFIHQVNKVLLVVAVILVGLRHSRVEVLKNLLHDVVHF